MAQQVSGSDKTLLEAIRDGDVPEPALMRWNEWQAWRSSAGRRPRQATDGYSVSQAQESAIWKSVMLELYGTEWSVQLASMEDEAAQPQMMELQSRRQRRRQHSRLPHRLHLSVL